MHVCTLTAITCLVGLYLVQGLSTDCSNIQVRTLLELLLLVQGLSMYACTYVL